MVSVDEAQEQIKKHAVSLDVIEIELKHATAYVLAENVYSEISFPPFDQSAMDGYAVNGISGRLEFVVTGEFKAGDSAENFHLKPGEACRIFTGSMLPKGTEAIVKQEDVNRDENRISVSKAILAGEHIRTCGEQIKQGDLAISASTPLNPGAIGFLSTLGIQRVNVFRKAKIKVIATGNELLSAGEKWEQGKIYESNTNTLVSALSSYHFDAEALVVPDSYELIAETIKKAIPENDLVLITGGISVGDYDFVGRVLQELEVEEKFYKVKQKPGKPLFFGVKDKTLIFALPGNPAAVLTTFYIYVSEALAGLSGSKKGYISKQKAQLDCDFEKTGSLTFFLKGKLNENREVSILSAQSSAMLSSFIEADCLIKLEENRTHWSKGDWVDVFLI